MAGSVGKSETNSAGGTKIISMFQQTAGAEPPYTVALTTSTATATFSFDGGSIFQVVAPTISANGQLVYFINSHFTHIKFSNLSAGDKYNII